LKLEVKTLVVVVGRVVEGRVVGRVEGMVHLVVVVVVVVVMWAGEVKRKMVDPEKRKRKSVKRNVVMNEWND